MPLTFNGLLVFPGLNGIEGLCHARLYERPPGTPPVVMIGALTDNPGAIPGVVIESVAAAAQTLVGDSRQFQLVTHDHYGGPPFLRVDFDTPSAHPKPRRATPKGGQRITEDQDGRTVIVQPSALDESPFQNPRWTPITDIDDRVGEHVRIWPKDEYTSANLFGQQGQQVRDEVARRVRRAGDDLSAQIHEFT